MIVVDDISGRICSFVGFHFLRANSGILEVSNLRVEILPSSITAQKAIVYLSNQHVWIKVKVSNSHVSIIHAFVMA